MVKRIADLATSLEGLGFLVTLLLGVGGLGFVAATWVYHLFTQGRPVLGVAVAIAVSVLAAAAIARMPIALIAVFGGAVVVGTAFLIGAGGVVLP